MLMKNLRVFSTAMCRYRSLLETLSVFGGHLKTDESLHIARNLSACVMVLVPK